MSYLERIITAQDPHYHSIHFLLSRFTLQSCYQQITPFTIINCIWERIYYSIKIKLFIAHLDRDAPSLFCAFVKKMISAFICPNYSSHNIFSRFKIFLQKELIGIINNFSHFWDISKIQSRKKKLLNALRMNLKEVENVNLLK